MSNVLSLPTLRDSLGCGYGNSAVCNSRRPALQCWPYPYWPVNSVYSSTFPDACPSIFKSQLEVKVNYSSAQHDLWFLISFKRKFKAHPVFKFLYDLRFRQLASSCLFSSALAILTSLSLLEHTKDTRPQGLCSGCPSGWRSLSSCIAHSFLPYFMEASVQMPYYQGGPPHPSHPDVPSTMPAVSNVFINWEQWVSVHDAGTIQGGDVPDASHFGFPLPQQKGLCVTCTVLCCKWGQCYLKIPSLDVVSLFSHDMWKHQGHSSKGAVSISPCLLVLLLSLIHLSLSGVHFLKLRWVKQSSNCLPDRVPQPRSLNVALGLDGYSQETCNYYISLNHRKLP